MNGPAVYPSSFLLSKCDEKVSITHNLLRKVGHRKSYSLHCRLSSPFSHFHHYFLTDPLPSNEGSWIVERPLAQAYQSLASLCCRQPNRPHWKHAPHWPVSKANLRVVWPVDWGSSSGILPTKGWNYYYALLNAANMLFEDVGRRGGIVASQASVKPHRPIRLLGIITVSVHHQLQCLGPFSSCLLGRGKLAVEV